jgi:hypothetical protein
MRQGRAERGRGGEVRMKPPSVYVKKHVIENLRKHAHEEARKYGHEVFGWLVGFFKEKQVYVLKAVKCTKYLRQSKVEAEADPSEESQVASLYPRNIGIVGLYHSHPFRKDYDRPGRKKGIEEKMFHSEVDKSTLKSRAKREENYVSAVTDGRSTSFFTLDKDSKKVIEVKPNIVNTIEYDKFMTDYSAKINLIFEKKIKVSKISDILKGLETNLIDYIYRNVEESEIDFEKINEKRWNVRLYAFEEERVTDNVIAIKKVDNHFMVNLRFNMKPEVFVTRIGEVPTAMRDEIADNILTLIRMAFQPKYLGKADIKSLELHLGNFKVDKKEFPSKVFIPPKRRMIIRKS